MTENTEVEAIEFKAGMYLKFIGYQAEVPEATLTPGQIVIVRSYDTKNGITVQGLHSTEAETLFEEEVSVATEEEIAEAVTAAEAAAAKAKADAKAKAKEKTTKAKAAAAAPAPAPEVAAKPAKAKATTKETPAPAAPAKAAHVPAPAPSDTAVSGVTGEEENLNITVGNDFQAVAEILQTQDLHEAALQLNESAEQTAFTLGGVLAHIYLTGAHKQLGYTGRRAFATYLDKELPIKYRRAMYLIQIYCKVTAMGVTDADIAGIGWSKLKELVSIESRDEFVEKLSFARDHSRSELIEHIRSSVTLNAGDPEAVTKVKMTEYKFRFVAEEADNINAALSSAANLAGSDDANAQLLHIINEWRSMTEGVSVPLEDAIRVLEARYGVSVVVNTDQAGNAIAGQAA